MLRDLTLADAVHVVAGMRDQDAACVRAVCGQEPGEWFAVERWQTTGPAWTIVQDGQPWAIGGMSLRQPWCGVLWLVARPGLSPASWRKAIRTTRTVIHNAHGQGVHRVEAHVLDGWREASCFAARLGLALEGVRRHAGSGGESIQVWATCPRG